MALDVYVGAFSRYFARDWENVVQKWAREAGTEYRLIGPGGAPQPANWDEVSEAVSHWRSAINAGLRDNLEEPLQWDESRDSPYFTDRPGYEGYGALLVWAAHAEAGSTPPERYETDWYEDSAFVAFCDPKESHKYRPLLSASLWLPGRFQFSFDFKDLTGQDVHVASNFALQRSLQALNEQTFNLSESNVASSLKGKLSEHPSLHDLAAFGFSVFKELCDESVEHHLPMLLDT